MIRTKPKPCKSTKTKGFGCKKVILNRVFGLCQECLPKWYRETTEGQKQLEKVLNPIKKKREEKERFKKEYTERKSLPALLNSVRDACHSYIRERDKGLPCISCGCEWKSDFDAGHFYSAAKFSNLKFDENNLGGQCVQCNRYNYGNVENYRIGLINRYGKEYVDLIDAKASLYDPTKFKWDKEELVKLRAYYREKLKALKK